MLYTPATHLEPGVVARWSEAGRGIVDVGPVAGGTDALAQELCQALRLAGFDSRVDEDVMGLKLEPVQNASHSAMNANS